MSIIFHKYLQFVMLYFN